MSGIMVISPLLTCHGRRRHLRTRFINFTRRINIEQRHDRHEYIAEPRSSHLLHQETSSAARVPEQRGVYPDPAPNESRRMCGPVGTTRSEAVVCCTKRGVRSCGVAVPEALKLVSLTHQHSPTSKRWCPMDPRGLRRLS